MPVWLWMQYLIFFVLIHFPKISQFHFFFHPFFLSSHRMWCALAECYERLSRPQDAIRCYLRADNHQDREGLALTKLAKLHAQLDGPANQIKVSVWVMCEWCFCFSGRTGVWSCVFAWGECILENSCFLFTYDTISGGWVLPARAATRRRRTWVHTRWIRRRILSVFVVVHRQARTDWSTVILGAALQRAETLVRHFNSKISMISICAWNQYILSNYFQKICLYYVKIFFFWNLVSTSISCFSSSFFFVNK